MTILTVEQLSIGIEQKIFIRNLSLQFRPSEIWGIFGPNGAGKTTFLHTIAGLLKPETGQLRLNDEALHHLKPKLRAQKIGILFQEIDFPFPSTVLDSVLIGRYPYQKNSFYYSQEDKQIAYTALNDVGLTDFIDRNVQTLSGGEKRRLALATLLTQDPDILLLDEPTNHLDIEHRIELMEILKRLSKEKNKTIIMILHSLAELQQHCDNIIVMNYLNELRFGKTSEVMNELKQQKPEFFNMYV